MTALDLPPLSEAASDCNQISHPAPASQPDTQPRPQSKLERITGKVKEEDEELWRVTVCMDTAGCEACARCCWVGLALLNVEQKPRVLLSESVVLCSRIPICCPPPGFTLC